MDSSSGQEQINNTMLVGQLAHEIKNPLSTIKINLKLIIEDLDALRQNCDDNRLSSAERKLAVVKKEAERLEQILDSFLRYTDKIELHLTDTDINELVGDMIDFYSPQGYSRSIIIRKLLSTKKLVCKVDANMLKQALLNLFINAQNAMENGGELIIRTDRHQDFALIQISDTGVGIPPDKLDRIFEGHSFRPGGRGVGLQTAKKIIETHNGIINVHSEVGKGTSFTIKLPLSAGKND